VFITYALGRFTCLCMILCMLLAVLRVYVRSWPTPISNHTPPSILLACATAIRSDIATNEGQAAAGLLRQCQAIAAKFEAKKAKGTLSDFHCLSISFFNFLMPRRGG